MCGNDIDEAATLPSFFARDGMAAERIAMHKIKELLRLKYECALSFERIGRAPRLLVLDNATEAGRMAFGKVTESRLFSQLRAHYRCESRYCNPYSGNEKGSVENAVGFLRRNLLVPVPVADSLDELNARLASGCGCV